MILTLTRTECLEEGIFGVIIIGSAENRAVTIEHSYGTAGNYAPKLPVGTYNCTRGKHVLHNSPTPFETFEVTGVPGHTGILFHVGNYNKDSDGCILVGESIATVDGVKMITNSKKAFASFMDALAGIDSFTLLVV